MPNEAQFQEPTGFELNAFSMPPIKDEFRDPAEIEKVARQVNETLDRMRAVKLQEEDEVAKVDNQLRPEIRRQRQTEIRGKHRERLDALTREVGQRAQDARDAQSYWTRGMVSIRGTFHKDPHLDALTRLAYGHRLARANNLLDWANHAAREKSLPLAAAIGEELSSRTNLPGNQRKLILDILATVPDGHEGTRALLNKLSGADLNARAIVSGVGRDKIAAGVADLMNGGNR